MLRLDVREVAVQPAKSGERAIVPGEPSASELVRRITSDDERERMPPKSSGKTLSVAQRELLTRWIEQGADYQVHWAFVAPQRPPLPSAAAWARNPIDCFVIARLQQEGLAPSPEAERTTLLRRVTLDLIGLPPTLDEISAFLADDAPDAFEKVIDRLLASPHYGERMVLPWLDAARYADSNGFQQEGDTHQYVWRDWLVRALNENRPFDQLATEMLAGDLLPDATLEQRVATGFNRCHLLNGEGGAIAEEQRNVIVFDRVEVTATTFLALTAGCAQCHDHKYDPITQRDYYQLFALFNQVPESGVPPGGGQYRIADPWIYAGDAEQNSQMAELEREAAAPEADPIALGPWELREPIPAASFDAAYDTDVDVGVGAAPTWTPHIEWEDGAPHALSGDNTAFYLRRTLHAARATPLDLGLGSDDALKLWLDGELLLAHKITRGVLPDQEQVSTTLSAGDHVVLLKIVNGGGPGGFWFRARSNHALRDLEALRAQLPRVMVMSDAQPRVTHRLERGNYETPHEEVAPGPPAFLPPLPDGAPPNRLGFAQWLFRPDHPLTARVQVNRAWQLFFATGLVKTSENFGVQGEAPSHPELLDWLAVELRESGWDLKRLHRLIVTSATYRQSSRVTPLLRECDPENRLLARGPRFRLPSLLLRDVALAASGLLDPRIGGAPVYPYQPADIWESLAITKERDFAYPQSSGGDLFRRSLYTFWRRTVGPGNMFDASARQSCKVRQSITSTPLHALTMLNDPTWVEAGRALAERVMVQEHHTLGEGGVEVPTVDARLALAFRRICARSPAAEELAILRRSFERALATFRADPDAARRYLAIGASPRDASLDAAEHAAYATVCLSILNLDEALTCE